MTVKVIDINLPEYNIKKKPNYVKLGKKVNKIIENNMSRTAGLKPRACS